MARILIGVTGSIAAYRSPDLIRELKAQGHELRVVLTDGGAKFVTPKTLETFAGTRILSNDVWAADHLGTDHIEGARWAELILVYGATANFMAKLAHGFCDDFLSLQMIATTSPVVLCPAMNVEMWNNAAVRENFRLLKERGLHFVGPIAGNLACGETGLGHIASHEEILIELKKNFSSPALGPAFKKNILLTFGSMRTAVDEVRFLQNSSSGRMGLELAKTFLSRGMHVQVLAGILDHDVENELRLLAEEFSSSLQVFRYSQLQEYRQLLETTFAGSDFFISAAAVLDFEVKSVPGKIERNKTNVVALEVQATPDFVAWASQHKKASQKVIAFALESGPWEEAMERASIKKQRKAADAIVVNRSGAAGEGPHSQTNELKVIIEGKSFSVGDGKKLAKSTLAKLLADLLLREFDRRMPGESGLTLT